jgi:hypothetical protein
MKSGELPGGAVAYSSLAVPRVIQILLVSLGLRWLRGLDLNQRPLGYEPNELPDCSTPQFEYSETASRCQDFSPSGQSRTPAGWVECCEQSRSRRAFRNLI